MVNTFIGGTLNFKIDGAQKRLGGNFKIKLGGQVRKPKNGLDGPSGFVTEYVNPEIDCELMVDGTVSVSQIKAINNSTLVVNCDNGRTYVVSNAWQTDDDPQVDLKEAMMSCKFAGLTAQEL